VTAIDKAKFRRRRARHARNPEWARQRAQPRSAETRSVVAFCECRI